MMEILADEGPEPYTKNCTGSVYVKNRLKERFK